MSLAPMAPAPVDPRPVGRGPVARVLVGAISLYRTAISPLRPPTCRYLPTCSEYAVEAIGTHGSARGSWLALRRLLRCHPWHVGGHDPVPPLVDRRGPAPLSVAATAGRQPVMSRYQSPASQPPGVLEC